MPEGEPITQIETNYLPAQPLDAGRELITRLGKLTSHIAAGDVQSILVKEYPRSIGGDYKKAVIITLESGQFVVVSTVGGEVEIVEQIYQRQGKGPRSPVLAFIKHPTDPENPIIALQTLLKKLETEPAERVQTYQDMI